MSITTVSVGNTAAYRSANHLSPKAVPMARIRTGKRFVKRSESCLGWRKCTGDEGQKQALQTGETNVVKSLITCDCLGTQSIDATALSDATGLDVRPPCSALCTTQIDRAQATADLAEAQQALAANADDPYAADDIRWAEVRLAAVGEPVT